MDSIVISQVHVHINETNKSLCLLITHCHVALFAKCIEDKLLSKSRNPRDTVQLQVFKAKVQIINQTREISVTTWYGLEPGRVLEGSNNSLDLQVIVETVDTFLSTNATHLIPSKWN